jgi:phosphoglycerol transferase MdoB-like AlkP superfamily enzyme
MCSYTDFSLKRFFETAKKQTWFANTIFIMVADHCNQIYYDEYQKPLNRFAVPILIYQPNSKYTGIDDDFAQQIDIYPTILDMIGYEKPFRSWGRSLFDKKASTPFFINYNGALYQFAKGNYICVFDGKKAVGFYNKTDKDLANNLIAKRNSEMNEIELHCKAFLQDYMNRVIDRQLHGE